MLKHMARRLVNTLFLRQLPGPFVRESGHCWSVPLLGCGHLADTMAEPRRSVLVLHEDGIPLRPAHAALDVIRGIGFGAYSHQEQRVYFATSDNSSPNDNGRRYDYSLSPWLYRRRVGQFEPHGNDLSWPATYRRRDGGAEQIRNDVAEALGRGRHYLDQIRRLGVTLAGKTVLEIGPGVNFGSVLVLAAHGARPMVADRFLAPWDTEYHAAFYTALADELARQDGEADARPIRALVEAGGYPDDVIRCVDAALERLPLPADSVDFVLSHAVVEHLYDLQLSFAQLFRVTRPGGFGLHQIDHRDHRDFSRPLEYLLLSEDDFETTFARSHGECGNRYRPEEVAAYFRGAGFELLDFAGTVFLESGYLAGLMKRLRAASQSRYRDCPSEGLHVVSGFYRVRKPAEARGLPAAAESIAQGYDAVPRSRAVPPEVGLYGLGWYTLPIVQLCRGAGTRVAFVVDNCPGAGSGTNRASTDIAALRRSLRDARIPVWTEARMIQQIDAGARLPVLVAANIENDPGTSVSTDPFLRAAALLRDVSGGRCTLLHPVILAQVLALPAYRRRAALFGYPGSGNILAKHLLGAILDRIDDAVPAPVQHAAALAEHYHLSTMALLRHLFRRLGALEFTLASMQFPTSDLTIALPGDEFAVARHIPTNRHLGAYFFHTHGAPSRLAVDELSRLGAPAIAVIRHPCETVLSWAAKLSRPPIALLNHPFFFERTVRGLAQWHRQLLHNEGRVIVLRYEDLVARRKQPLQALAERLGVPLSARAVDALYDRFLNRDLLPAAAPGHYYRGGSDKWKEYFLPHHVQQFRAHGLQPVCDRWGYDLSLPGGAPGLAAHGEPGPSGQKMGVLPLERLFALTDESFAPEPFPLLIHSRSREVSEAIRAVLHGREFLDHLNAAGLGPEPPPWIAPIPWQDLTPIFHPAEVAAQGLSALP